MSINKNLLSKGLKQATVLLALLIATPIIITIAFKALQKSSSEDQLSAYLLLGLASLLTVTTMVLAFKTIRTLLDALFNSKSN
uniref:DUF6095 family protein n=1 Tax=Polaribacter sp. TaxID=1920175 RepID=UPI004047DDA8